MEQKTNKVIKWLQLFKKATDFDSWGQLVEATKEYSMLAKQIRSNVAITEWDEKIEKTLLKIASCMECRAKLLQSVVGQDQLTLQDVRRLEPVFKSLSTSSTLNVPGDLRNKIDFVRRQNAITTPSPELNVVDDEQEGTITFTSQNYS